MPTLATAKRNRQKVRRTGNRPGGKIRVALPKDCPFTEEKLDALCADSNFREWWALSLCLPGARLSIPGVPEKVLYAWMLGYCKRQGIDQV